MDWGNCEGATLGTHPAPIRHSTSTRHHHYQLHRWFTGCSVSRNQVGWMGLSGSVQGFWVAQISGHFVLGPRPDFRKLDPVFVVCRSYAQGFGAFYNLDERSVGIQRPRSKILTALRWSAVKSGASITVARRPSPFVRTLTKVAFISESVFSVPAADFWLPSLRRTRLTNIKPITVANVCNRNELSAHWCEGPQDTIPPFLARRKSSSTFHWPRKACTMRPLLQA